PARGLPVLHDGQPRHRRDRLDLAALPLAGGPGLRVHGLLPVRGRRRGRPARRLAQQLRRGRDAVTTAIALREDRPWGRGARVRREPPPRPPAARDGSRTFAISAARRAPHGVRSMNAQPGPSTVLALLALAAPSLAQTTPIMTRASVSSAGVQADGLCLYPRFSADARYVTFSSYADTLVAGDTNARSDIFIRDQHAGTTIRAS